MRQQSWRPDWRSALPRVSYVRWWLFRIAMIVVVVSFFAAAMVPLPNCGPPILHPGPFPAGPPCDSSFHIPLRLQIAATGIVVAFVIAFIGARLDQLILWRRRVRAQK
jgi:hypothetical protein